MRKTVCIPLAVVVLWTVCAGVLRAAAPATQPAVAKRDAARAAYQQAASLYRKGVGKETAEVICLWSHRWAEAEVQLTKDLPDQRAALAADVERVRQWQKEIKERVAVGYSSSVEAYETEYFLADAELRLQEFDRAHPTSQPATRP